MLTDDLGRVRRCRSPSCRSSVAPLVGHVRNVPYRIPRPPAEAWEIPGPKPSTQEKSWRRHQNSAPSERRSRGTWRPNATSPLDSLPAAKPMNVRSTAMRVFKSRAVLIGSLLGVGVLLGGTGAGLAIASGTPGDSSARCSDATLHGTYNFATESTQISGPPPNGRSPMRASSSMTAKGETTKSILSAQMARLVVSSRRRVSTTSIRIALDRKRTRPADSAPSTTMSSFRPTEVNSHISKATTELCQREP